MEIRFSNPFGATRHRCEGRREGNWIVFRCPLCPGFERRINLVTGDMVRRGEDADDLLHEGSWAPVGLKEGGSTLN